MNKSELVDAVASEADVTKTQADLLITVTLDQIIQAVSQGQKVTLVGFGVFEARSQSAREGRNPQTGETLSIPEKTVPKFKPGKEFKERVGG